jgi:hypothetical protein
MVVAYSQLFAQCVHRAHLGFAHGLNVHVHREPDVAVAQNRLCASRASASCFTTGIGAWLRRVFGSFVTLFQTHRLTLNSSPLKSSHSRPRISPFRKPVSAAQSTTVQAGCGRTDSIALISSRL